jgi:L-fucose isomerase-like protein
MQHICRGGFEHHVVMTRSKSASILNEAFSNYFGWETDWHRAEQ